MLMLRAGGVADHGPERGGVDAAFRQGRQAEASRQVPGMRSGSQHVAGCWQRGARSKAAMK